MAEPMGEFDLIERYFKRPAVKAVLGVGDDCALLQPAPGMQLAISTDMLVEGRHFFAGTDAFKLGHKSLAVNLSDLAACGAKPLAFLLSLALPSVDQAWLEGFSKGLFALADEHGCELIGGDTTRGPLTISITVFGEVPAGQALLRSGAQAGDDIYVSGALGDAKLALDALTPGQQFSLPAGLLEVARQRLEQPVPRVRLGLALRSIATAAIDVSDGLLGDLGHLLKASNAGASIDAGILTGLLCASSHPQWAKAQVSPRRQLDAVLAGGDDYELAFTAPASARAAVELAAENSGTRVSRIGIIERESGIRLVNMPANEGTANHAGTDAFRSYDHFS